MTERERYTVHTLSRWADWEGHPVVCMDTERETNEND